MMGTITEHEGEYPRWQLKLLRLRIRMRSVEWQSGYHGQIENWACADWMRVEFLVLEFQLGCWENFGNNVEIILKRVVLNFNSDYFFKVSEDNNLDYIIISLIENLLRSFPVIFLRLDNVYKSRGQF